jgi:hypothetical protein
MKTKKLLSVALLALHFTGMHGIQKKFKTGSRGYVAGQQLQTFMIDILLSKHLRDAIEVAKREDLREYFAIDLAHLLYTLVEEPDPSGYQLKLTDAKNHMYQGNPTLDDFNILYKEQFLGMRVTFADPSKRKNSKTFKLIYELVRTIGSRLKWSNKKIEQECNYIFDQLIKVANDYRRAKHTVTTDRVNTNKKTINAVIAQKNALAAEIKTLEESNAIKEKELMHFKAEYESISNRFSELWEKQSYFSRLKRYIIHKVKKAV